MNYSLLMNTFSLCDLISTTLLLINITHCFPVISSQHLLQHPWKRWTNAWQVGMVGWWVGGCSINKPHSQKLFCPRREVLTVQQRRRFELFTVLKIPLKCTSCLSKLPLAKRSWSCFFFPLPLTLFTVNSRAQPSTFCSSWGNIRLHKDSVLSLCHRWQGELRDCMVCEVWGGKKNCMLLLFSIATDMMNNVMIICSEKCGFNLTHSMVIIWKRECDSGGKSHSVHS